MHPFPNTTLDYLTHNELVALFHGSSNSRYSKVKRLLAEGKLIHIRRGLSIGNKQNEMLHNFYEKKS